MPQIIFGEAYLAVIRGEGDPMFYGIKNTLTGESRFLYWLKNILNADYGYDLIKKPIWKDGFHVDPERHYLRTRSVKSRCPKIAIYNHRWMLDGAEDQWKWKRGGRTILAVERDIFTPFDER